MRRIVALAAAAALAATFVAGCSSGSGTDSADQAAAGGESTPVGDTMEGDGIEITDENLAMLAPIVVVPDQTEALANVGDGLEFMVDDPLGATIESDNPAVVEVIPGREDGGITRNPGGTALSAGTANVTVTNADGTSFVVVVTIEG
ncbi:MAG: hypothetical protein FJW97_05930 [Actinobacteria bacterium]|nr:hypothetical protein [Actinomycetota bacterium]